MAPLSGLTRWFSGASRNSKRNSTSLRSGGANVVSESELLKLENEIPPPSADSGKHDDEAAKQAIETSVETTPLGEANGKEVMGTSLDTTRLGEANEHEDELEEEEPEFELWVEANLEAGWCLEDNGTAGQWRDACQTPCLRRRWDEFEMLGHSVNANGPMTVSEAYQTLGLPDDCDDVSQVASAFRCKSRACHPDKAAGNFEEFNKVTIAYQVLQKALQVQ
eukprot:TRINITY_DN3770_c0_g1_i1.p1 TRINITY_DN3770_c0_g1~~TRINITY_DN3770_c0_g1_i1.p1  ORF type:complete len:222 (-),score=41.77 TRINITY_DN3770_c0_g1_i1:189-854(-)